MLEDNQLRVGQEDSDSDCDIFQRASTAAWKFSFLKFFFWFLWDSIAK